MRFVRVHELWKLAEGLPARTVRVADLKGLDDVRWFGGPMNLRPTCRTVAEHARDIYEADLSYPIILSPAGEVLDGMHRVCKAVLQGIAEIPAITLPAMPPYRWRVLPNNQEVPIPDSPPNDGEPP